MPRKPGMYLPGILAHVVQRGNNHEVCFFSDEDDLYYLEVLEQGCRRYDVELHTYCRVSNHVHLLMTQEQEDIGISQVMQHIGRLYVAYMNKTYRRSGTLWEGRHKASLVEADTYLLTCYRYIELNPVIANMVMRPGQYRWSSYAWHAWGKSSPLIFDHLLYPALGHNQQTRQQAYRELFRDQIMEENSHQLRKSLAYHYPLGNDCFRKQIEKVLGRRVGYKQRGRPESKKFDGGIG